MPSTTSTFGRTRSGRSPWPIAIGSGAAAAALIAAVAWALNPGQGALLAAVLFATTVPITTAGAWALVVDRATLRGAVARPDDSVETAWLNQASSSAFFDLIMVGGLAAGAVSLIPGLASIPAWQALIGVTLIGMADFGVRLLVLSRRAG